MKKFRFSEYHIMNLFKEIKAGWTIKECLRAYIVVCQFGLKSGFQ